MATAPKQNITVPLLGSIMLLAFVQIGDEHALSFIGIGVAGPTVRVGVPSPN